MGRHARKPQVATRSSLLEATGHSGHSPANCEENSVREKLILFFDALRVLSLQWVFRAMHLARGLNY